MLSGSSDLPSFQIKQDDKFFNRLMSKETSAAATPSFRVYYGGATGSVPFKWESQPGTPKHPLSDTSLPPLTPPPSYYSNQSYPKPTKKRSPASKLFNLMFPRFGSRKIKNMASSLSSLSSSESSAPASPSSTWSSSHSSRYYKMMTTPDNSSKFQRRSRFSSFDSVGTYYDQEGVSTGSPTSTLCFGIRRPSNNIGARGCYKW